jgi:hypothetical protein
MYCAVAGERVRKITRRPALPWACAFWAVAALPGYGDVAAPAHVLLGDCQVVGRRARGYGTRSALGNARSQTLKFHATALV